MKYQTQQDALARMELDTRRKMRRFEDQRVATLSGLWTATKKMLKSEIALEYSAAFPKTEWNLPEAKRQGVLLRLSRTIKTILDSFKTTAMGQIAEGLALNYQLEAARAMWMLDQATPPSVQILPPAMKAREAEVEQPQDWSDYLDAWITAYEQALGINLSLGALNGGSLSDAMREVDATKIKTPGGQWDLGNLMEGLYTNALLGQQSAARSDVAAANDQAMMVEIWQTLEDAAVCPQCDDYDGQPREEAEEEIPAHFRCRCFYRLVPRAWAELLAEGDETEKAQALQMDDMGLVPTSMIIRGEDGLPAAAAQVTFDTWASKMGAISGGLK
jgi:hypothetical protein